MARPNYRCVVEGRPGSDARGGDAGRTPDFIRLDAIEFADWVAGKRNAIVGRATDMSVARWGSVRILGPNGALLMVLNRSGWRGSAARYQRGKLNKQTSRLGR